jgi:hypothetical protein
MEQRVNLLLDYAATYPNDSIIYPASDTILCAHADAGFLNKSHSRSQAGAHMFLSENDPVPRFNGAVLFIAQIIKFVTASAAKSELAAGMVQAWVGHFVTSITLPKVILSYLSTYNERRQPDKTAQKAQTTAQKAQQHDKQHHHSGAICPSSGVDLMSPCRWRGGRPSA